MAKIFEKINPFSLSEDNVVILNKSEDEVISFNKSDYKPNIVNVGVGTLTVKTTGVLPQSDLMESKTSSNAVVEKESDFDIFKSDLLSMLQNEEFEAGYSTRSENFVKEYLNKNRLVTMDWLGRIFHDYFYDVKITIGILHIISHYEYEDVNPYGPFLALSGTRHKNAEVKDFAIKAFENWANPNSLTLLESVRCSEMWLQKYIEAIIRKLKEE